MFTIGDTVKITDETSPAYGMTGVVAAIQSGRYHISLGGGFFQIVSQDGLVRSFARFGPVPERVRELAQRGPVSIERRFGDRQELGDGSIWQDSPAKTMLASPPNAYRTPAILAVIAEREATAAHADAEAEARAIVEVPGERGNAEVTKPDPHDGPIFRCQGCGKAARLLIADRHNSIWCRACLPEDSDDPPPAGVAIPLPPRKPDHDMGMAVAEVRMRVLWDYQGTAGNLIELIAAERAA